MVPIGLWILTAGLCAAGWIPALRHYRSLLWASSALALITSLYPFSGNVLGEYWFGHATSSARLPLEIFGIAWWVLGAWLLNGILDLILRRTLFPRDHRPHARRLFADMASVLFYLIAFVGCMETVLKQPVTAVLATSGVLAVVLGLALQSTLGDLFSGLAINIDRPFGAGDWITLAGGVEGQVLEINWRSTRIRTLLNDLVVLPNSAVAKSPVTNHSRGATDSCALVSVEVDAGVASAEVIALLETAVNGTQRGHEISGSRTFAAAYQGTVVSYQVIYAVAEFGARNELQSEVIRRIGSAMRDRGWAIGPAVTSVRLLRDSPACTPAAVVAT